MKRGQIFQTDDSVSEFKHLDINGQWSMTASQSMFISLYTMSAWLALADKGSCQPAKRGRPIGQKC